MSVYATKGFVRFARKVGLAEDVLLRAARDLGDGRFDADLGGGVFKQRIARKGGGKSAGFRTIILLKAGGHCFFAHGFAKSRKANVSTKELAALKKLALELFDYTARQIAAAVGASELMEVAVDNEEERDAEG